MKRSEINALMKKAVDFFNEHHFRLPPFAFWSPEEWKTKGSEADEIRECRLGWDLTDFGSGDFHHVGLLLFTIRNGTIKGNYDSKPYAEKIMIQEDGQITPWHFHRSKMEDIINRGGGNLVFEVCNSDDEGKLIDTDVVVSIDGVQKSYKPYSKIILAPGESITIVQGLGHQFYGEGGKVLIGEVSSVNDDKTDNFFIEAPGRYPDIEEDEQPLYLLCTEYPK